MARGGYKVLDFQGAQITAGGDPIKVEGIYERVESSKKATLLENLTVDETELPSVYCPLKSSSGAFVGDIMGLYNISISDTDMVTITDK